MTTTTIIYLLGFLIAYFIPKILPNYPRGKQQSWSDIRLRLFVAVFSWVGVLIYLIIFIRVSLKNPEPPRWL